MTLWKVRGNALNLLFSSFLQSQYHIPLLFNQLSFIMRAAAAFAFLLSVAASTSAYLVNTPSVQFKWKGQGAQT